jgi:GR25 family glycosyltransferase involved in LPS biosynthesis
VDNLTQAIVTDQPARTINDSFPYKVCINLDRRPERWQQMQRKFVRHGVGSVYRFPAIDGDNLTIPANWVHTPGAYGCLLSHVEVVREARRRNVPSVLIFEDDVVFDDHFESKFGASIGQLPRDWDILFFGALHRDEPIEVAPGIARITQAYSTYAYALRATVFDAFIELNHETDEVLDNNSMVLQRRFNCYCFMPHLAWVEADHSDAQQRFVHHWYLRESLVLFGPRVDRLLSSTTIVFAHDGRRSAGAATENLMFLVRYYERFFSSLMAMVIVEQGPQPTVNPSNLAPRCKYVFWQGEETFDREECFARGIAHSDSSTRVFIFSDSDIYLETLDVRANLLMCERYDGATGFSKIIDLTNEESLRLRRTMTTRGIDITKGSARTDPREGCCRFLNREVIRTLGRKEEGGGQCRVFRSPNHAVRVQRL